MGVIVAVAVGGTSVGVEVSLRLIVFPEVGKLQASDTIKKIIPIDNKGAKRGIFITRDYNPGGK